MEPYILVHFIEAIWATCPLLSLIYFRRALPPWPLLLSIPSLLSSTSCRLHRGIRIYPGVTWNLLLKRRKTGWNFFFFKSPKTGKGHYRQRSAHSEIIPVKLSSWKASPWNSAGHIRSLGGIHHGAILGFYPEETQKPSSEIVGIWLTNFHFDYNQTTFSFY